MGIDHRGAYKVEADFATMNIGPVMIERNPIAKSSHFDASVFHTQFQSYLPFEVTV